MGLQDGARFRATTSFTLINFEGLVGLVMHFELYAFECVLSERSPRTRERSLINRRFQRAQCFFFCLRPGRGSPRETWATWKNGSTLSFTPLNSEDSADLLYSTTKLVTPRFLSRTLSQL